MTEKDFPEDFDFELNPVDKELEAMFGDAYLDSPDLSQEDIPQGLKEIVDGLGLKYANISSDLIGKAIERAPDWNCQEAQEKMLLYLKEYVSREPKPTVGWLDGWGWIKHREGCGNPACAELEIILHLDKYLTPEEMKIEYEEFMAKWFPEERF